jgi:hypothetical protein
MYFLREYNRFDAIPGELLDTNIAFNYGKLGNLLKLQNNKYYLDILDSILKTGEIVGRLKNKFNLEENFEQDDIISLLYYFGYLTIKEPLSGGRLKFIVPNYVINNLYYNYFLTLLRNKQVKINNDLLSDAVDVLKIDGNINPLVYYIENLIKEEGKRTLIKYDEKYIQLYFSSLLRYNKEYLVYTEYEVKNGYVDLMLLKGLNKTVNYEVMIEFKYLPEKNNKRRIIESKRLEAIEQLNKYSDDDRFNKDTLKKYVVIFVGNNVKLIEEA